MALMNRHIQPKIETIFVMPNEQFSYTSSSLIKQVAKLGGDVSHFVPPNVAKALKKAFAKGAMHDRDV
jgi:pantetheine-phosphate adenylyltransferase